MVTVTNLNDGTYNVLFDAPVTAALNGEPEPSILIFSPAANAWRGTDNRGSGTSMTINFECSIFADDGTMFALLDNSANLSAANPFNKMQGFIAIM